MKDGEVFRALGRALLCTAAMVLLMSSGAFCQEKRAGGNGFEAVVGYDRIDLPPFDPALHVPPAPDYGEEEAWLHLPENRGDAGEGGPGVDVFWIYPTILFDRDHWLMDVRDADQVKAAAWTLRTQASVFDGQARIYAPGYRQANARVLLPLPLADPVLQPVFDVGQTDILRAFAYYMKHYNNGRPFILAGHSQGSYRGIEMAKELWGKSSVPPELVAAYVIGFYLMPEEVEENPGLRMCETGRDTGCFITYNSMAPGRQDVAPTFRKGTFAVNPLTWRMDEEFAPASLNQGAVFQNRKDPEHPEMYSHFAAAQIVDRGLVVTEISHPEKVVHENETFPQGVYHIDDYALFYENIRSNVGDRIKAFWEEK